MADKDYFIVEKERRKGKSFFWRRDEEKWNFGHVYGNERVKDFSGLQKDGGEEEELKFIDGAGAGILIIKIYYLQKHINEFASERLATPSF